MADVVSIHPPAEAFHIAEFIVEELDARGWSLDDLATRMGGDFGIDRLALDFMMLRDPKLFVGPEMAAGLARAFGVSAEFFVNLDAAWRQWMRDPHMADDLIERLQAANARLRNEVEQTTRERDALYPEVVGLRAEVERLTAELEALRTSVSLLEEQHQLDWTERERQSTQLLHLSDQAEALRTDAKRLDAIERNLWFVEPRYQYDPVQFGVGKAGTMKVEKSLRAAIDAARSAT